MDSGHPIKTDAHPTSSPPAPRRGCRSDSLLCESCGYTLDNLPVEARCPECGRPVASSRPEARPGSPWQRRPGPISWVATNGAALRRPDALAATLRPERSRGTALAVLNCLLAAAILVAPFPGVLVGDPIRAARAAGPWAEWLAAAWVIPLQVGCVVALLLALTALEAAGLTFWARRRGARMLGVYAWQVCAHATIAWVLAGVLMLVGLAVWRNLLHFGLSPWFERQPGIAGTIARALFPAAGLLAGLLAFEIMVWRGGRVCRFAGRA